MSSQDIADAYERYRVELRRFLSRRSPTVQDADDLVQEVYMQLLRFPPKEILRQPQSYLYRIAWHVVNNANMRARKEMVSHRPLTLDRTAGHLTDIHGDEAAARLDAQEQLSDALAQLPPLCQAAIILFKRDGLSYKEIAAELGISIHTVKKYIARAILHFKTLRRTSP